MKTRKADIRISVRREGTTRKLELFQTVFPGRYQVKIDGRKSSKLDVSTITEVTDKLRKWLANGG